MLGNDVVDLQGDIGCPETRHPRFDRRVFDPAEREALGRSGAPERLRWMLWAAKESAYKALRRIDPEVVFAPASFGVTLEASGEGSVRHASRIQPIPIVVQETPSRVHAAASLGAEPWLARVGRLLPGERRGDAARRLAVDTAVQLLDLPAAELRVARRDRMPVLTRAQAALPVVLSLSHHGRYAACAIARLPAASVARHDEALAGYAPGAPALLEVAS